MNNEKLTLSLSITSLLKGIQCAKALYLFKNLPVFVTEHWYDQLFLISHDIAFTEMTDQIISLEYEVERP
ncbi:MAG: hypothetical protein HN366_15615 [Deltaproteobacteria bacterium]|nr:hypothetical protein [Deltaproteobacteria bacterium]